MPSMQDVTPSCHHIVKLFDWAELVNALLAWLPFPVNIICCLVLLTPPQDALTAGTCCVMQLV